MKHCGVILALVVCSAVSFPQRARGTPADTLRLSLDESVARAMKVGEEARLAEADLATAKARYLEARSTALPRLTFTTTYTRRIESVFRDTGPATEPFEPDTLAPLEERVRDLEDALPTAALAGLGRLFSATPFGSENSWVANLGFTQKVFQGGSIWNSIVGARHAMRSAEARLTDSRAEIVLGVRRAYLAALLADRGARISELALEQAESQLTRVRLRQETGNASEFELLQAEVQRDNQIPVVRQAYLLRDVADLDLRRLANIDAGVPLVLTTPLLDEAALPGEPVDPDTAGLVSLALQSPAIRSAEEQVEARSHAVAVYGAERWPKFSVFANASQQAYPDDMFPKRGEWLRDVNAGLLVEWNLFDGFLTKGVIDEARAQRNIARHTLQQAREAVRLQVMQSYWDLARSAADLRARARTVELARRAFDLANIRYEEGASDLIEVADSRIAFQIAQTNEAQARHDYFVALARLERLTGRPLFTEAAR